ncbi:MAG: S-layer homology domain-containing protein [Candidatus Peribacteraceae bacterium]
MKRKNALRQYARPKFQLLLGTYLLFACIALAQQQNMRFAANVDTTILPDFTVDEISVRPFPMEAHHSYTFLANVRNISSVRTDSSSAVQLFIDEGDNGSMDVVGERRSVTRLAAGGHHLITWGSVQSVDWEAVPGNHRAMVCAGLPQSEQQQGFLNDANQENNCVDFAFSIGDVAASSSSSSLENTPEEQTDSNNEVTFSDTLPDWAAVAIREQARLGIVKGYDDGRFGADDPVTRGQLVTLLYRILRHTQIMTTVPSSCEQSFDDVPHQHYAYTPLCALLNNDRIDAELLFLPDASASRATTAMLTYRILESELLDIIGMTEGEVVASMPAYTDVPSTNHAYEASVVLRAAEIMTGYPNGNFGPDDQLNRAQAALIMYRLLEKLENMQPAQASGGNSASHAAAPSSFPFGTANSSSAAPQATPNPIPAQPNNQPAQNAPQNQNTDPEPETILPDYIVTEIVPTPNMSARSDYSFLASIQNVGGDSDVPTLAYLSIDVGNDGIYDYWRVSDDALLHVSALPSGSTESVDWNNVGASPSVDWIASEGTHKIRICVNMNPDFAESNGSNNCNTVVFTVTAAEPNPEPDPVPQPAPAQAAVLPNFIVDSTYLSIEMSGKTSMEMLAHNLGGASTEQTYIKVWLTYNGLVESNTIQYRLMAPMAADGKRHYYFDLGYLPNIPYVMHVCLDQSYNGSTTITESDETNNCASRDGNPYYPS